MGNIGGDTSGFREANVSDDIFNDKSYELDQELINELKDIYKELAISEKISHILKIRIAKACLKIIEITPLEKKEVLERAYEISSFIEYKYDDALDEVFENAAKLSPPKYDTPDFVFELWNEMKEHLEDYIRNNS